MLLCVMPARVRYDKKITHADLGQGFAHLPGAAATGILPSLLLAVLARMLHCIVLPRH
jgi:hypothetical protein